MKTKKERLERKIQFRETTLEKLYDAYEAISSGRVQSYMIDDRQLTNLNLAELSEEIRTLEAEIDELAAELSGGKRRKAFGIVPRDW